MNNKVIITTLLAATGLGLSTLSLADTNSNDASAAPATKVKTHDQGVYIGGQVGYVNSSLKTELDQFIKDTSIIPQHYVTVSDKAGQVGGRVYAGYQFNKYLAAEAGYSYLNSISTNFNIAEHDTQLGKIDAKSTIQVVDLAAKGILPLSMISDSLSNASLFAKIGVADMIRTTDVNVDLKSFGISGIGGSNTTNDFLPEFGGGAEYIMDSGLGFDVSYMRLQGRDNKKANVPTENTVMGGVSYHFAA